MLTLFQAYASIPDFVEAIKIGKDLLKMRERTCGMNHQDTIIARVMLAQAYYRSGDYNNSILLLSESPADLTFNKNLSKLLQNNKSLHMISLNTLIKSLIKIKDYNSAKKATKELIYITNDQLNSILTLGESQRLAWAGRYIDFSIPSSILNDKDIDEIILQWKGVVLDSLLHDFDSKKSVNTTNDEDIAREQIQKLKSQIAKIVTLPGNNDGTSILKIQQKIDLIESKISKNRENINIPKPTLQENVSNVISFLSEGDVVLDIVRFNNIIDAQPEFGVSILCKGQEPKFIKIKESKEIIDSVENIRKSLLDGNLNAFTSNNAIVYNKLWKPIEQHLPQIKKKIYIAPDAELNFLSFASLVSERNQFLCENYEIAYIGSGRDFLKDQNDKILKNMVVFADPEFSKDVPPKIKGNPSKNRSTDLKCLSDVLLPQLPGSAIEGNLVSLIGEKSNLVVEKHFGLDSSKLNLTSLTSPSILHLATHGFILNDENYSRSGDRGLKVVESNDSTSKDNELPPGALETENRLLQLLERKAICESSPKFTPEILKKNNITNSQANEPLKKPTLVLAYTSSSECSSRLKEGRKILIGLINTHQLDKIFTSKNDSALFVLQDVNEKQGVIVIPINQNDFLAIFEPMLEKSAFSNIFVEKLDDSVKKVSIMRKCGIALTGGQNTLRMWGRGEFPDPSNDGILTAEEVVGLNLFGTWLVTLSACDTGIGELCSGEGVLGLRRAFMMAGAQNLLMTLWPVSDELTPNIMTDFYKEALATHDAAGSLAKVQRDWLVNLRKEKGILAAVRDAGPFAMVVMANPNQKSVTDLLQSATPPKKNQSTAQ